MRFRAVNFFFKEAFTSLKRNNWMFIASVGTVAVSLIIFGISLLTVANTNYITGTLESDVAITVYLKDEVTPTNIDALKTKIKNIQGVAEVKFIDKDKALQDWKKSNDKINDMLQNIDGKNPLPDQFQVKTVNAKQVEPVAKEIYILDGVDKVNYGQGMVEKLFAFTKWIRWVGYSIMALLGLAAIFLISTTIRLTFYARRKEIQIMKFVGATDWFIRWPYLLEGMFIGLMGAIVSMAIILVSYTSFVSYIHKTLPFISVKSSPAFMASILGILALAGIFIGVTGSLISMRKYLRV